MQIRTHNRSATELIKFILKGCKRSGELFHSGEDNIRKEYREYAKIIHPDVCDDPDAEAAFQQLSEFYEDAIKSARDGTFGYLHRMKFEIGERIVYDDRIIYIFDKGKEKYRERYSESCQKIRYKDMRMTETYRNRMPVVWEDDKQQIVIHKKETQYPMDLFLKVYGPELGGRDIAWMISRMCDLLCFLKYNGLVLNDIQPRSLFIDPDDHSISIYGGWWYAAREGEKMIGTSKEVYSLMPSAVRTNGLASAITDMESMKQMFRTICAGKDIPKPITDWIDSGSTGDPYQAYFDWNVALDKAYGPRKFKKFETKKENIYQVK